jgi:hypothetical protein
MLVRERQLHSHPHMPKHRDHGMTANVNGNTGPCRRGRVPLLLRREKIFIAFAIGDLFASPHILCFACSIGAVFLFFTSRTLLAVAICRQAMHVV